MGNLFKDDDSRKFLLEMIRQDVVEVQFEKKDGTTRVMNCTLNSKSIPADKVPKTAEEKEQSSALRVFDIDKQEWRSFRWDSVKSFKFGV